MYASKKEKYLGKFIVLALLTLGAAPLNAQLAYDEAVSGDLSSDAANPTSVAFGIGSNTVTGSVVNPADTRDYITFTIPPGQFLTALTLVNYDAVNDNRAFHLLNEGSTSFEPSPAPPIGSVFGSMHLDEIDEGTDTLPEMAASSGNFGTGFTTPLGAR